MRLTIPRLLLFCSALACAAEPLGPFEQRFSTINFERSKWSRTVEQSCRSYAALEDGAKVEVVRNGSSSLVAFRATKGLKVRTCGSTASFDEGFEALGNVSQSTR